MSEVKNVEVSFNIAEFKTLVQSIVRSQANAAKGVGKALLQVLYFANKEHSPEAANLLVAALRKSTKQAGIMALLEAEGNLAWTKIGKTPGFVFFDAGKEWNAEEVERLRDVCSRWEEYKPAKVEVAIDLFKMLEAVAKKGKAAKEGNKEVVHAELLDGINALLAKVATATIDAEIKLAA